MPSPHPATADANASARKIFHACAASGGVVSSDEAVRLLQRDCDQPVSRLARWIVERRVVHFVRAGQILLPAFQFELPALTPQARMSGILCELAGVLDDPELAEWFTEPNPFLGGALPADRLESSPEAVRNAARAMRFLLDG